LSGGVPVTGEQSGEEDVYQVGKFNTNTLLITFYYKRKMPLLENQGINHKPTQMKILS
jgi:hypothetical protein